MSKLYFAKMNVSDKIFDVYEGNIKLDDLLDKIFAEISTKKYIRVKNGQVITDTGEKVDIDKNDLSKKNDEPEEEKREGRIKFLTIDKINSDKCISGFLGEIGAEERSTYDAEKDDISSELVPNALDFVTFYFDVSKEILAFTTTFKLSRKKVLEYFECLIYELSAVSVKFVQETDSEAFTRKIQSFDLVSKMEIKLFPPNGQQEDFDKLLGGIKAKDMKETGASYFIQKYSSLKKDGLKMASKLLNSFVMAVKLGYANAKITGKLSNGSRLIITSVDDAPFIKEISSLENKSQAIVSETAKAGIKEILTNKANVRKEK